MVERKDPSNIVVLGANSEKERRKFIEGDFLIRSGMCPNGHGLMKEGDGVQECGTCPFVTNVMPEKGSLC